MPSAAAAMSASSNTTTGALPPSSRWHALQALRRRCGDLLAGAHRAGDADHRGDVVHHHRPAGVAVAAHDVEDAGGEELGGDLGEQRGAGRRRVAGLQHDRVARGERRPELPHRHHHRVVPRRDLRAHADRLAADERRHVVHVLAGALALEVAGGGGEEADLVDHRRDLFAAGQVDRLAAVLDLECDQFLGACLDGVGEAEQRQRTLARRRVAPRVERRATRPSSRCRCRPRPTAAAVAYCSPVAGLITAVVRPSAASTYLPLMKFLNAFMRLNPLALCFGWCARLVANGGRS